MIAETRRDPHIHRETHIETQRETHREANIDTQTHTKRHTHIQRDTHKELLQRFALPFATHINFSKLLLHSNKISTKFI